MATQVPDDDVRTDDDVQRQPNKRNPLAILKAAVSPILKFLQKRSSKSKSSGVDPDECEGFTGFRLLRYDLTNTEPAELDVETELLPGISWEWRGRKLRFLRIFPGFAKLYDQIKSDERQWNKRRFCLWTDLGGKMFVFDGISTKAWSLDLNDEGSAWKKIASRPKQLQHSDRAVLNGQIYLAGGETGKKISSSVYKFNPNKNTWSKMKSMNRKRSRFALVASGGFLYAIGGFDGRRSVASVERYDPCRNNWKFVAAMGETRTFLAAIACKGEIYAIGGISKDGFKVVERYNPEKNYWQRLNDLSASRIDHAATVRDGKIIVFQRHGPDTSVDLYDPCDDTWTFYEDC